MEGAVDKQLRQGLLAMFIKRPEGFMDRRKLKKIIGEEGVALEDLFFARYDPQFLANVTNKNGKKTTILSLLQGNEQSGRDGPSIQAVKNSKQKFLLQTALQ
jgi:hypothetical protein